MDYNFTFRELRWPKHIMMVKGRLQMRLVFLPNTKGLSLREATSRLTILKDINHYTRAFQAHETFYRVIKSCFTPKE